MKNIIINSNIFFIFIFILLISANFLAELFPCRFQNMLRSNIILKHIFGLFTMIVFVVLSSGIKYENIFKSIKISLLLYFLFILITKCQIYVFLIILVFLGITYIINILKQEEIEGSKKEPTEEDSEKVRYSIYDDIIYVLYSLIFFCIIFGVMMYMGEKKMEYKKDFDYITFFIGNPSCKGKSPKINIIESLKNSFN